MSGIGTLRVKSFFRSLDFCPDFFSYLGKRLNKRAKVNFKILTSQTGKQPIAIHILPKFSRSKSYQAMRFDQLIEHKKINIYLRKSCRKWGRETRCRALFVFKKSLYEIAGVAIKTKSRSYDKNKQYNCSQRTALIQRYVQFWFFWKRPGISFSTKFCVWFLKKKIMLYSMNWPNFNCLIVFTSWDIMQYVKSYVYISSPSWPRKPG